MFVSSAVMNLRDGLGSARSAGLGTAWLKPLLKPVEVSQSRLKPVLTENRFPLIQFLEIKLFVFQLKFLSLIVFWVGVWSPGRWFWLPASPGWGKAPFFCSCSIHYPPVTNHQPLHCMFEGK